MIALSPTALREELRVLVLGAKHARRLRGLHRRPLTKRQMVQGERENAGGSTVCHILGSGWSLPESLPLIGPDDYVVGYNLAALTGIAFDAYHMERIDERTPGINAFYRRMIEASGQRRPFVKNFYEDRTRPEVINWHIAYGCTPYRTFSAGGYFRQGQEEALCEYLLDGGGRFILQYRSSVMQLVVLYALAGFRTLVLHGQDLSGPYFFDVADFPLAQDMAPRACGILPAKPAARSELHPIDQPFRDEPRIVDTLPALARVLARRGTTLACAVASSPIARDLPLYRPETTPAVQVSPAGCGVSA